MYGSVGDTVTLRETDKQITTNIKRRGKMKTQIIEKLKLENRSVLRNQVRN